MSKTDNHTICTLQRRFKTGIIFLCLCVIELSNVAFCQNNDDNNASYGYHIVTSGENLYRISQNYFLKEADIIEINPGLNATNIKTGQRLKIPITTRNKKLLITEKETKKSNNQASQQPTPPTRKSYAKNKHLNVAMFLPLHYDKVKELDFNAFNINEKRKKSYKSFEYITFYEGARIALDLLEKDGYNVSLYVYDVGEDDVEAMKKVLSRKELKEMNLMIALVFSKSFELCAEFAQRQKIPLINPMSKNISILNNNHTFKIQPSPAAEIETIMRYVRASFEKPNITILHSNTAEEKPIVSYFKQLLEKGDIPWTIIDCKKFSGRMTEKILKSHDNIVITTIGRGGVSPPSTDNETFVKDLLNKLHQKKDCKITLFGYYDWLDLNKVEFSLLQQMNFHFLLSYLNDYTNSYFVDFVKLYREHFKGEPDNIYASLGYDIMMYFVPAMIECGDSFMDNPNYVGAGSARPTTKKGQANPASTPKMIYPFYFERINADYGYQNKKTNIYRLVDYKIISIGMSQ